MKKTYEIQYQNILCKRKKYGKEWPIVKKVDKK